MAQSGFTPILTYASNTASAVPAAGNLTNSSNGAELAVNTADKRLFVKNSGGTVVELGTNPSSLTLGSPLGVASGGTGAATFTANNVLLGNGTSAFQSVAPGANGNILTSNGTTWVSSTPSATGVTSITFGSTGLTPSTATAGAVTVAGTLAAANGGTGQSSYAVGDLLFASTTTALSKLADVATGNALISGGVGVAPSYGKIGLTTHVSGTLPIANGGTNAAATPTAGAVAYGTGTAYAFNTAGSSGQPLLSGGTGAPTFGTLSVGAGGTGSTTLTANSVLLGNGTSALQVVAPGTNGNVLTSNGTTWQSAALPSGVSLSADNTWTGTQTFAGTSAKFGVVLTDAAETATVSATAATGTINYDITTQSVVYYTSNASANWTVNFRASSGTSLNTALATGQSVTVAFLVTQGTTAYYNNVVQVDGTTSGVTTRWVGGAPTAGNPSGIDSYRYVIIKTASATFTVLASVTQFKA